MKNNEDYEIKIGDIKPGCEEDIIEKQKAIASLYEKNFPALSAKANRFFPGDTQAQKDAIQEFFMKKICSKEVGPLKVIENAGAPYMVKMFKNHCIDIHRGMKRQRKEEEAYIDWEKASQSRTIGLEWIPIEDRGRFVINKYKKAIARNFRNEQYPEIFELMIQGYSNQEISEKLGINISTVGTARHRIQKFMKNKSIERNEER